MWEHFADGCPGQRLKATATACEWPWIENGKSYGKWGFGWEHQVWLMDFPARHV